MPKRRSRNQKPPGRRTFHNRKVAVVLLVALTLIAGAGILAQVVTQKKSKKPAADFTATTVANNLSKEYVYAGSKLVATIEPTASVNGDDAEFVSMCVYDGPTCVTDFSRGFVFNMPELQYFVEVTMKNTGTTTWTTANGYKLGSQNPANNTTWGAGKNRIALPYSVPPGGSVTFPFGAGL